MRRMGVVFTSAVTVLAAIGLLTGTPAGAAPVKAKSIVLTTTPSAPVATQSVDVTVAITPRGGGAPTGGAVTILDGATTVGTGVATTRNTRITIGALTPGTHSLKATYGGDATTAAGSSGAITVTVAKAPTRTTVVAPAVTEGDVATFKATVKPTSPADPRGVPTGRVEFTAGGLRASVKLNASGVATWRRTLPGGDHAVTATYTGDSTYGTGTVGTTTLTVAPPAPAATATGITAGDTHSCAVLSDGTGRCWGANNYGRLGDGTQNMTLTPVTVTGLAGATAIATSSGSSHTCALIDDGTARCWGANNYGQLGNGTTDNSLTPVTVTGLTGAVAITAGANHTCAVLGDGTARCWGANLYGRLGDGTTDNSNIPVTVTGLTGATAITAGTNHTCALRSDGTARCWGSNNYGRLGDGTQNMATTPVTVTGLVGP